MPYKDPAKKRTSNARYYAAHREAIKGRMAAYKLTPKGIRANVLSEARRRGTR